MSPWSQNKQDETKRHRSIFDVPTDFFDSCRVLESPFSSFPNSDYQTQESKPDSDNQTLESKSDSDNQTLESELESENDVIDYTVTNKAMRRWSCNTCKAEFGSLQDQRFHFKSDLHLVNIKRSIAGKSIVKEDDFDGAASDLLCNDYSSFSGTEEDEDERDSNRQRVFVGISKRKIFLELQNGERVSVWRCLVLDESAGVLNSTPREVIEKLKVLVGEPSLRIVLLARGGHFAGCVFDGDSIVAHKTFNRYVIRAKAGKKQSSKDAGGGGRSSHSAGASLRRHNELGLKRDIQELLTLWKPHFAVASCVFISAPSSSRQLLYDGDKPCFTCQPRAIRNIPLTVRRPTLEEARRVFTLLVQISPEKREDKPLIITSETESIEILEGTEITEAVNEMDGLDLSAESEDDIGVVGTWTPLHEAAKSGNAEKVLELLELGLDPCVKNERGQTAYVVSSDKEVRNNFRRFMASNLERWDWEEAKVSSALTKEMEESQAEKEAKRKARAKELKKLRKAKQKKAQAEEAAQSQNDTGNAANASRKGHVSVMVSEEEELRRVQEEREKRAAAERGIAESKTGEAAPTYNNKNAIGIEILRSCCNLSLAAFFIPQANILVHG